MILGLGASLAVTRVLSDLLFGLSPTDPQIMGVVCVAMLLTVAAAAWLPARRAARVDPIVSLRTE